jgi:anaerobic selenocysteine-containing dehydrogenase
VDRVNRGRLGPKGLFGWRANNSPDRLTRPLVRAGGQLRETDWETAMTRVTERSRQVIDEHGRLAMAFYTSGQLFAEEYYTQCVIARGGVGTPHLDGNTRLCTATAQWALVETFGSDGDPGSYTDIDACDTLFLVGHNVAETQTVLWARMLDRLDGPSPPRLVVVDPRRTAVAARADVHLPIRPGTNVALLNATLHEMIANSWVDHEWVQAHTTGYGELEDVVAQYSPQAVEEICGVPADSIRAAARILGTGERVVSTVLQGVYQSHQATAAAVQVNNINLLRGMIGRPGCAVFQMNGQPTAENTRETGADGSLPGYRDWQNDEHVREIAEAWNVDILQIPHWAPPTHAMEIFRQCENGTIRFLWVTATNPLVSLPELNRIRSILGQERLFLQYLAAIRAMPDVLALETMFFTDEVRDPREEIEDLPHREAFRGRELTIAKQLIESMTTRWKPQNYRDTYRKRVEDLIERKAAGGGDHHRERSAGGLERGGPDGRAAAQRGAGAGPAACQGPVQGQGGIQGQRQAQAQGRVTGSCPYCWNVEALRGMLAAHDMPGPARRCRRCG